MRDEVLKLKALGRMPDQSNDDLTDEQIDVYSDLLDAIEKPITIEEAAVLIQLLPDVSLYGVEWSLLHLIESLYKVVAPEVYESMIAKCPSVEWRDALLLRFNNARQKT